MTPDDAAFVALTRTISVRAGLALDAYKDKCLRRRIAVRMRACGVHTYAEYQALLDRTPTEYERLTDALTINVTRFYRNAETWEALRSSVIPALWADRRGALRIWSAGCSSGEEPYTLAMLLAEQADRTGGHGLELARVDATDIDRESLVRAQEACYRSEALAELPASLAVRYTRQTDGGVQVVDRVRQVVTVRRCDLTADPPPSPVYDLVMCRNVVIYFDRPMQERLFRVFHDALAPGGYLILGKVETLFGPARDMLQMVDPRERIYRRPA